MHGSIGKRIGAFAASALIAGCLALPSTALALTHNDDPHIPDAPLTTTGDYITGAATCAAMPALEILGIASLEESGQFISTTNPFNWEQPKYMLIATDYNSAPSPFLANWALSQIGITASPAAVYNPSREGGGNGPNAALSATDPTDAAVLAMNPDLRVGNGGGVDSGALAYGFSNNTGLVTTMYSIAAAADAADVADTARTLRYNLPYSATDIAEMYESYIFGTIGAVQEAIDTNVVPRRTVALVQGVVGFDTTTNTYVYELLTSAGSNAGNGTAAQNRYLEITSDTGLNNINIATNYANSLSTGATANATGYDLGQYVDLIMVGGQQGSSNYSTIMAALITDGLLGQTYYVCNNGSAGATYGAIMNSVENAQNAGRILGMLYPEVISQRDWLAYYFQMFYHVNLADLAATMEYALSGGGNGGVRNALAVNLANDITASDWTGFGGYTTGMNAAAVEAIIDAGYLYYLSVIAL